MLTVWMILFESHYDYFVNIVIVDLPSRVWELYHITIGHSVDYECPIVLTNFNG